MDGKFTENEAASELYDCKKEVHDILRNEFLLQEGFLKPEQTTVFTTVKCEDDLQVKLETEEILKDETEIYNTNDVAITLQIESDIEGNISLHAINNANDQKPDHTEVPTIQQEVVQEFVKAEPINYTAFNDGDILQGKYAVTENEVGKKVFKCQLCAAYQTSNKQSLKSHILRHSKKRQFKCNLCDYSATVKADLTKHMAVHSQEKPFKCALCDYSCIRKAYLVLHMSRHRPGRSIHCNECDFSTNHRYSLAVHVKSHLKQKPYNCEHCTFSCTNSYGLARHQRTHEQTLYSCETCGHQTHHKGNFLTHRRTHNRNRTKNMYRCNSCPYFIYDKHKLKEHIKFAHPLEKHYRCDRCSFSDKDISLLVIHMKTHLK